MRNEERGNQKGNDAESGIKDIDFETHTRRWKKLSDEWNCAVESDQLQKIWKIKIEIGKNTADEESFPREIRRNHSQRSKTMNNEYEWNIFD